MGCHFLLQGIFPTQGLNPKASRGGLKFQVWDLFLYHMQPFPTPLLHLAQGRKSWEPKAEGTCAVLPLGKWELGDWLLVSPATGESCRREELRQRPQDGNVAA